MYYLPRRFEVTRGWGCNGRLRTSVLHAIPCLSACQLSGDHPVCLCAAAHAAWPVAPSSQESSASRLSRATAAPTLLPPTVASDPSAELPWATRPRYSATRDIPFRRGPLVAWGRQHASRRDPSSSHSLSTRVRVLSFNTQRFVRPGTRIVEGGEESQ